MPSIDSLVQPATSMRTRSNIFSVLNTYHFLMLRSKLLGEVVVEDPWPWRRLPQWKRTAGGEQHVSLWKRTMKRNLTGASKSATFDLRK